MEDFNLLVTYRPHQAGLAEQEIHRRIGEVGSSVQDLQRTGIDGVYGVKVDGNPKRIVAELKEDFLEHPETLTHTYHWVPIDRWVPATEEAMVNAVKDLAPGIGTDEKWKLHLHKRHTGKHSSELVQALTDPIVRGPVDLENPDKVVVVEILGDTAGISLVDIDEILDVNKIRQEIGLFRI